MICLYITEAGTGNGNARDFDLYKKDEIQTKNSYIFILSLVCYSNKSLLLPSKNLGYR